MVAGVSDQSAAKVSLTGIKPTGQPHLGNFVGAIGPALEFASSYESVYFIADYHALTSTRDPKLMAHYTRSVAATWLAAGLDPNRTIFYRQSDVPQTFELQWVLSCFTAKGLMNRAHAYKAARDRNRDAGVAELDSGVNMGLYNYPVLMAADILIMETDVVPVGTDQLQHVEYAADIAGSFNAVYQGGYQFTIPQGVTPSDDSGRSLPGTDGRKMSKSYDNTIPLFAPEAELRKTVRRIPTDSTPVEAPKDPDGSAAFQILTHFAPPELTADVRGRLEAGGMGWGDLKNELFEVLNQMLAPLRQRYEALMEPGSELESILQAGAETARKRAQHVLDQVRETVGVG